MRLFWLPLRGAWTVECSVDRLGLQTHGSFASEVPQDPNFRFTLQNNSFVVLGRIVFSPLIDGINMFTPIMHCRHGHHQLQQLDLECACSCFLLIP